MPLSTVLFPSDGSLIGSAPFFWVSTNLLSVKGKLSQFAIRSAQGKHVLIRGRAAASSRSSSRMMRAGEPSNEAGVCALRTYSSGPACLLPTYLPRSCRITAASTAEYVRRAHDKGHQKPGYLITSFQRDYRSIQLTGACYKKQILSWWSPSLSKSFTVGQNFFSQRMSFIKLWKAAKIIFLFSECGAEVVITGFYVNERTCVNECFCTSALLLAHYQM